MKKINERSVAMNLTISANIEALANKKGSMIEYVDTGCVTCPREGIKVSIIIKRKED